MRNLSFLALMTLMALGASTLGTLAPEAAVPASSAEAQAFLGGRPGKIVYLKGYDSQIHYVDFSDSIPRERKVSTDPYCLSPMISPDGTRIVYEQHTGIWIRDLIEGGGTRNLVFSRTLVPGQTMEPHWWIDPKTKDEYIQYTTGIIEDHEWPPKSGNTYLQKVVASKPLGPPVLMLPFMMSAARSQNGMWGATSHHSTGMYRLYPEKLGNAFYDATNWTDFGIVLACNASISPSSDPARQNRVMHLHSGGNSMGGKVYDNHKAVLIRSWNDADVEHPLWWMGIPGDRSENDGSGNLFWDSPEWSNDENYFTATGSKDLEVADSADLYIVRVNLTGESRLFKAVTGPGKNKYGHLWIKNGVTPARLRLDSASLSFAAYKKDTADPKPKVVSVTNAGDGTLPLLTVGTLPAWLKVTLAGNGTNLVKLTTSVSREGLASGVHQAKVAVSYGQGADSASYLVTFRYSDPILTTLRPVPVHAVIPVGDSLRLSALALDQVGNPMPTAPAIEWSGEGALRPSSDGWFRADSAMGRGYLAIAASGQVRCTTQVTVTHRLLRIDAGAAAGKAEPGWTEDAGYAMGGTVGAVEDSFSLAGLSDPAPQGAFRSWLQGFTGYRMKDLRNARYRIRMHFVAPIKGSAGTITLKFEGQKLIQDHRLPAGPDSVSRAADIREVSVSVTDGNGLDIEAIGTAGAPALAALEIYESGTPPVSLRSPNGGESFKVGDTLAIRWLTDSSITSCGIQISVDSGAKWLPITRRKSVGTADKDWQDFRWAIPDTMDGVSLVSQAALISVYDYFGTDRDRSDKPFRIEAAVPVRNPALPGSGAARVRISGGRLWVDLPGQGPRTLELIDMQGTRAWKGSASAPGRSDHDLRHLKAGVYHLIVSGGGRAQSHLLPWLP